MVLVCAGAAMSLDAVAGADELEETDRPVQTAEPEERPEGSGVVAEAEEDDAPGPDDEIAPFTPGTDPQGTSPVGFIGSGVPCPTVELDEGPHVGVRGPGPPDVGGLDAARQPQEPRGCGDPEDELLNV